MRHMFFVLLLGATACSDQVGREPAVSETTSSPLPPAGVSEALPAADTLMPSGWLSPGEACSLLADRGLPTGGYKHRDSDEWGCIGTRVTSSEAVLIEDEATYMIDGTQNQVHQITLVAQHFYDNAKDERFTLGRTAIAAETVGRTILGDRFPEASLEAFRAARNGTWTVDKATIEVERDDYPTGKGHSVYYRIKSHLAESS